MASVQPGLLLHPEASPGLLPNLQSGEMTVHSWAGTAGLIPLEGLWFLISLMRGQTETSELPALSHFPNFKPM